MGKYFGTDGFRGQAGVTLTAEQAFAVGKFLGWYFGAAKGRKCRAVIGKDTRLSSYMLEYALAAGLTSSGGDAYILHVTTTPSVSFVTRSEGFDCGVMISASHNPFYDNGIKLMNSRGEKMEEGVICLIEDYLTGRLTIGGKPFVIPAVSGEKIGRTVDFTAGRNRYIGHLISLSTCSYKGLKVGLDCANGSSYKIARSVFVALGAEVTMLGAEPDGVNVNSGCGATDTAALRELVRENRLDIGFAFDGDADRCICVDEKANVIDGDGIIYACADYLKSRGELISDKAVVTVMSNGGLIKSLAAKGISCEICAVGDRIVYEKMTASGACLGGEQSGHIIFGKVESTGDGLVTAIMLMEVLAESRGKASELTRGFEKMPQKCVNVRVANKARILRERGVSSAIDSVRGRLKGRGRLLVRPSGTEELIRVMAECSSEEECERYCAEIVEEIEIAEGRAGLPGE